MQTTRAQKTSPTPLQIVFEVSAAGFCIWFYMVGFLSVCDWIFQGCRAMGLLLVDMLYF